MFQMFCEKRKFLGKHRDHLLVILQYKSPKKVVYREYYNWTTKNIKLFKHCIRDSSNFQYFSLIFCLIILFHIWQAKSPLQTLFKRLKIFEYQRFRQAAL